MVFNIRPINPADDEAIAYIIRRVGAEFGAVGEGFGPADAEVAAMSQHYLDEHRCRYFVALLDEQIVGGCGISPFAHHQDICELRKLFLLPAARGRGIGKALTLQSLAYAKDKHFRQCYLDTLSNMSAAQALYLRLGFVLLAKPLDGVVHTGCDVWMLKDL